MVAKIKQDMDQLDKQLTQAESTVETATPALKSIVPFIFVSIVETLFLQNYFPVKTVIFVEPESYM